MANIKSTNLLPQVFRTDTNQKFLNATVDQLVSRPELKKINGYIGRIFSPASKYLDTYITEESALRQNYQLEPAVVVKNDNGETQFHGSYIDLLQQIQYLGGDISNQDRLFANESYSYDGLIDLDKLVNFNQYYWLPNGPDPVDVMPSGIPTTESFTVTRDAVTGTYKFNHYGGAGNPQVVLAKGGVYQFKVNQPGNPFWIQSDPGIEGYKRNNPTTSSRDVMGVVNNGIDVGTITWKVPATTAQDGFAKIKLVAQIDYAVPATTSYNKLQNRRLAAVVKEGLGFDGGTHNLMGKKCIFLADIGISDYWAADGVFDLESFDTVNFEESGTVVYEERASIWTIKLVPDSVGELVIKLVDPVPITNLTQKVSITNGVTNANKEYYLDREDRFQVIPDLTAQKEYLYYQDGTGADFSGRFKLVEPVGSIINIETEIIGKDHYKSPNGVMFTDGLKIRFDSGVIPATYIGHEFYVEGVGSSIKLVPIEQMLPEEDFTSSYIINPGVGYQSNEIVTVVGGTYDVPAKLRIESIVADTATALSTINMGSLYAIGVTHAGSGYITTPGVTVEPPPVGTLFSYGTVVTIGNYIYTPAGNYYEVTQTGKLAISPPTHLTGSEYNGTALLKYVVRIPATASATMIDGKITEITVTNPGSGYKSAPKITVDNPLTGGIKQFKILDPGVYSVYPDNPISVVGAYGSTAKIHIVLAPNTPDYITINRGSMDRNAWSRRNRWFHVDVINATAGYLQAIPVADQNSRAQRPIIEFDPNIQLFNHGSVGKDAVAYLDFENVIHARVKIENFPTDNSETAIIPLENYDIILAAGDRIVFAADTDVLVRDKVYTVHIVNINGLDDPEDWRVHLVAATDSDVAAGSSIIATRALYKTRIEDAVQYWFDGSYWYYGQQKTSYNQFPKFDMFTENNVTISNQSLYRNSSFQGTELFSYAIGSGVTDKILGFPLSYRSFQNVGDIQFQNDFDNDTFTYEDAGTITAPINQYYLRENLGYDTHKFRNVWITNSEQTKQFQVFNYPFTGDTNYFNIDISPAALAGVPTIIVYVNDKVIPSSSYVLTKVGDVPVVRISIAELAVGDMIAIRVYSKTPSRYAFYEVPLSLDYNSINSNFKSLTLGQVRNHLVTMYRNSTFVTGSVPGPSNIRDLKIKQQGGSIMQHASPVIYSNLFLLDKDINFVKGVEYAQREYTKFKNRFLEISITTDLIDTRNIPATVDAIMQYMNRVKNSKFPWYYSDMVPYTSNKSTLKYIVLNPELRRYELSSIFNDTILSNRAVIVYYYTTAKDKYGNIVRDTNNEPVITARRQLNKDQEFVFEQDRPAIRLLDKTAQLYNDIIVIDDYSSTDGCFAPETPSKLGLYPKFEPKIYVDNTYVVPTKVIQGHDGSLTPSFGDYRDDLLLELEQRIYNNIKMNYRTSLMDIYNIIPGKFRDSDYTIAEYNSVLTQRFLKWVGNNRVNYSANTYFDGNDPYTWNYKNFKDTVDGEQLPGSWRACYKYFYDTDRPHTNPWEMLGFSEEPHWWEARYGVAPFTGGNLVLWEDLEAGYIAGENRYDARFARPGLLKIIPVDDAGNLVPPTQVLVANFSSAKTNASFSVGDIGPVENAWRRSSEFPFAVQLVSAIAKPGYYFGNMANVDRYVVNEFTGQHGLTNNHQRITPTQVHVNGKLMDGTIDKSAGYINWIGDYLTSLGLASPGDKIKDYLKGLSVRLSYKMAGFVDKKYIKVIAEQSSPSSTGSSVIIPDDNYEIYLNKSSVIKKINYSGVIIQRSNAGWTVSGYDLENPFFTIIPSLANNNVERITSGKASAIIYKDFQNYKVKVPYGFEFNTRQQVVDFLVSYGRFLTGQGMRFDDWNTDLQRQQDFTLSGLEFLTWAQQGWKSGSILVVSPVISKIKVNSPNGFVDAIENSVNGTKVLDQNFVVIKNTQFTVMRNGADFSLTANQGQSICFASLNIVQYEHALIFDNITLFNDVVYLPELGNRQYRLKIVGSKTGSWNGQLDIPGFIYGTNNVEAWQVGTDYQKGALVSYKNNFYTALENLIAAQDFDPAKWKLVPHDQIKTGLLPNFSQNAQLLEEIYDINDQPKNSEIAKFSNSLIGFRERGYLTDVGIDVESQVKFYSGYIKQKGTKAAVDALSTVKIGNLNSKLSTYEEWALRVGGYGSIDSNDYVEVTLNESQYNEDPTTFLLMPDNSAAPDQIVAVSPDSLWRRPNNYDPKILANLTYTINQDKPITAGYVNISDVDDTIFDIRNYVNLDNVINAIGSGYKIWVARDFNDDWNVYRVSETNNFATGYEYGLNSLVKITTFDPHGFSIGNIIALKGYDKDFDGFYRIFEIDGANTFYVIANRNVDLLQKVKAVYSTGTVFLLTPLRTSEKSGIQSLEPPNYWKAGDTIWVDNDGGKDDWAVYQKQDAWTDAGTAVLGSGDYISNSGYGSVVRFNSTSTVAVVGAPGIDTGRVRSFTRPAGYNQFFQNSAFAPLSPYAAGYGSSLDIGTDIIAVGAPESLTNRGLVFVYDNSNGPDSGYLQTIKVPTGTNNDQFGYSLSISTDDRWLYVGAPGVNKTYVYAQDQYERRSTIFDGKTGVYVQEGTTLVTVEMNNHGYTNGATANLTVMSGPGSTVRNVVVTKVDNDTFTFIASAAVSGSGTLNVADYDLGFVPVNANYMKVAGVNRVYISGLDFTTYDTHILFNANAPIGTDTIKASEGKYFKLFTTLTAPTEYVGRFGHAVKTGTEGAQVVIGAPDASLEGQNLSGAALVYDRLKEGFYTNGTQNTFTPLRALGSIFRVTLNGNQQTIDVDYVIFGTNTVKFINAPVSGQFVEIEINEFNLVKVLGTDVARANSAFGRAIDFCPNNCSIYISSPLYSRTDYFAGRVYRYVNQGRVYGTASSNIPVPFITLTGNYVQVDATVTMTTFAAHELQIGDKIAVTIRSGSITGARSNSGNYVVTAVPTEHTFQYQTEEYVTADGFFTVVADRLVNIINIGDTMRLNGIEVNIGTISVVAPGYFEIGKTYEIRSVGNTDFTLLGAASNTIGQIFVATHAGNDGETGTAFKPGKVSVLDAKNAINKAEVPGVTATIVDGQLVINSDVVVTFNKLSILPGLGTVIDDIGLNIYPLVQAIEHPYPIESEYFGDSIKVSDTADILFVGSRGANTRMPSQIDTFNTIFDQDTTRFADFALNSGTVYIFDYFTTPNDSITSPGQFSYVQQLSPASLLSEANFGGSIDVNHGFAIIGASNDSSVVPAGGEVYIYTNLESLPAWKLIKRKEPKVDYTSIYRAFAYSKANQLIHTNFDLYDPAKGKILGLAEQELDYKTSYDPARYNQDNNTLDVNTPLTGSVLNLVYNNVGTTPNWGKDKVGEYWWNMDAVRYIDYEQDSLTYRARNWGRQFPGSVIEVCEWVESTVPPTNYTGPGKAKYVDGTHYSISYSVDRVSGLVQVKYYFWVVNPMSVIAETSKKNMSAGSVANIINNPQNTGVAYMAAIRHDAFNLYGVARYLSGTDTALNISYSLIDNENIIHNEFEMIAENNGQSFIPAKIVRKLQDSLTGTTIDGHLVPDPAIPIAQRYGISSRPRQSIFIDRLTALENMVGYVNQVLATKPIVREFDNQRLYAQEPQPLDGTGEWDMKTSAWENLDYMDKSVLPIGFKVLVTEDTRYDGLWSISTLLEDRTFELTRIQKYRTDFYIQQVDWYSDTFDKTEQITYTVDTFPEVGALSLAYNDLILVNNDGTGRFAYYRVQADLTVELVGLQYGTVQIKDALWNPTLNGGSFDSSVFDAGRFDQYAVEEVRNIFESIYKDIFIKSLSDKFSTMFFVLMNYMFTEQQSVDWIFKSSFLSILHHIRSLDQSPNYVKDNQSYYLDYISEVKPYRTQIREYLLNYDSQDVLSSNITDFDLPGYYDTVTSTYRSPVVSNPNDTAKFKTLPYLLWNNSYKLQVSQVVLDNHGVGYTEPPVVTIAGGGGKGATAEASINYATGRITSITVTNPGSGYTEKPVIYINGSGSRDTGALLVAKIGFAGAIQWTEKSKFTDSDVILYEGDTYVLANANTTASGQSFVFPNQINGHYVPDRYNSPIFDWVEYGIAFDTDTAVMHFNNQYYIANADVINANLFANSAAYFPYGNVVAALYSNVSFNFGNVQSIDVDNKITAVEIVHAGAGFTQNPTVFVQGPGTGGNVDVIIDQGSGKIDSVRIHDRGNGYFEGNTNLIVIDPGTSATATARLNNVFYIPDSAKSYNTTRGIKETIKFDRVTYGSNVHIWTPNSTYFLGETISYGGEAWRANTVVPFTAMVYPSTQLVAYEGNTYAAANADTTVSAVSVTFNGVKYINPSIIAWSNHLTYTANTVVQFGDNYYISANASANVSGVTYTFGLRGNVVNANVQTWSNTKTYTTSFRDVNTSDVFKYQDTVYVLSNTIANASGRSFNFPAWSNTTARAGRINANVVMWEPDAYYSDVWNTLFEYQGNVYQANTEIHNVSITANSPRFFPNANVIMATTSNLTFSMGNVVASTAQYQTFNQGNVILGTPEITFNFGNARLVSNASAVTWSNTVYYPGDTIVQYGNDTYMAANIHSSVNTYNFTFPAWSNHVPRSKRIGSGAVQWQPNVHYDTETTVVFYLGNPVIANTEIGGASLYANAARYFGNANVVTATSANLTFNTSNLMPINAAIYPTIYLGLDTNIAITKGTKIGVMNSTGRAVIEANVTQGNLIYASNTVGTFGKGTGAYLYEVDPITNIFTNNLNAKVLTINSVFEVANYTKLDPAEFDNANDRTMAYYQPNSTMPARDLGQLFDGIEYPGVQVQGPRYDSRNTLTTDVLEFFASNQSIRTTNLPAFNFNRNDLLPGTKFTIAGSAANDGAWTIRTQKDNIITVVGDVSHFVADEHAGQTITISFFNQSSPLFVDTVIQSNYVDTAIGLRPEDINIDGGKYIDTYTSHAPQELVPGRIFDNLNMTVYTQMKSGSANVGYRVSHNMYANSASNNATITPEYFRIREFNTTTLSQDLLPTDEYLHVVDVNRLPPVGKNATKPGVVYVNGEKITYWGHTRYDSLQWVANVQYEYRQVVRYEGVGYKAANANITLSGLEFPMSNAVVVDLNTLTRLHRGADGTGIPLVHHTGTQVQDSSENQRFPENAHHFTWLNEGILAVKELYDANGDFFIDTRKSNISVRATDPDQQPSTATDGAGLENSSTIWADFLRKLTG